MDNIFNTAIPESELIITKKGTIYHVDLAPEQLAETVITMGDPGRVAEVSRLFDRIECKAAHREFVTHTGYVGSKRLSVISTGIGPDNIDIVLNELDALVNIDLPTRTAKNQHTKLTIIRLGTCGGLQADVPADSLVVSTHAIGLDYLMHYYDRQVDAAEAAIEAAFAHHAPLASRGIMPYVTSSSQALCSRFKEGYVHGITATCPGFYAPQGRSIRIPPAFPTLPGVLASFRHGGHRILNFEMETAAIYGLGRLCGHECLSISTIVANRANHTFTKDAARAVDNLIRKSLEVIATL